MDECNPVGGFAEPGGEQLQRIMVSELNANHDIVLDAGWRLR